MKRKRSDYEIEQESPTLYETLVKTPSPHKEDSPQNYDNLLNFNPDIRGRFKMALRIPDYKPFWKKRSEYNKILYSIMTHFVEKYRDKGLFLSQTGLMVPENIDEELETFIINFKKGQTYFREPSESVIYWKKLMKDINIKMIFIFTIVQFKESAHATWTIIDKRNKVVEYFDPQGSYFYKQYNVDWIQILREKYQIDPKKNRSNEYAFIPSTYKISNIETYCPIQGFQYLEDQYGIIHELDHKGYCMLWCLFMLDLRIRNVNIDIKKIQTNMISNTYNWFLKNKGDKDIKKRVGNLFKKFIRDYGMYIQNIYHNEEIENINYDYFKT